MKGNRIDDCLEGNIDQPVLQYAMSYNTPVWHSMFSAWCFSQLYACLEFQPWFLRYDLETPAERGFKLRDSALVGETIIIEHRRITLSHRYKIISKIRIDEKVPHPTKSGLVAVRYSVATVVEPSCKVDSPGRGRIMMSSH